MLVYPEKEIKITNTFCNYTIDTCYKRTFFQTFAYACKVMNNGFPPPCQAFWLIVRFDWLFSSWPINYRFLFLGSGSQVSHYSQVVQSWLEDPDVGSGMLPLVWL